MTAETPDPSASFVKIGTAQHNMLMRCDLCCLRSVKQPTPLVGGFCGVRVADRGPVQKGFGCVHMGKLHLQTTSYSWHLREIGRYIPAYFACDEHIVYFLSIPQSTGQGSSSTADLSPTTPYYIHYTKLDQWENFLAEFISCKTFATRQQLRGLLEAIPTDHRPSGQWRAFWIANASLAAQHQERRQKRRAKTRKAEEERGSNTHSNESHSTSSSSGSSHLPDAFHFSRRTIVFNGPPAEIEAENEHCVLETQSGLIAHESTTTVQNSPGTEGDNDGMVDFHHAIRVPFEGSCFRAFPPNWFLYRHPPLSSWHDQQRAENAAGLGRDAELLDGATFNVVQGQGPGTMKHDFGRANGHSCDISPPYLLWDLPRPEADAVLRCPWRRMLLPRTHDKQIQTWEQWSRDPQRAHRNRLATTLLDHLESHSRVLLCRRIFQFNARLLISNVPAGKYSLAVLLQAYDPLLDDSQANLGDSGLYGPFARACGSNESDRHPLYMANPFAFSKEGLNTVRYPASVVGLTVSVGLPLRQRDMSLTDLMHENLSDDAQQNLQGKSMHSSLFSRTLPTIKAGKPDVMGPAIRIKNAEFWSKEVNRGWATVFADKDFELDAGVDHLLVVLHQSVFDENGFGNFRFGGVILSRHPT